MKTKKENYLNNREHKNVPIRLEDWSEDYNFYKPYSMLVAYPICKEDVSLFVKKGNKMRLEMKFESEEKATNALNDILSNKTTFKDYKEHIEAKYHDCI